MVDFVLTRALARDRTARDDERDDAVILLAEDDAPESVATLLDIIFDSSEDDWLAGRAGEALGYIWSRSNAADLDVVSKMRSTARSELLGALDSRRDNPFLPDAAPPPTE
jgi:hypothetical protein